VDDAPEKPGYCAPIERTAVGLLQRQQHVTLAIRVAAGQALNSFERANLHRQPRSPVQKLKQGSVYLIDFRPPVLNIH